MFSMFERRNRRFTVGTATAAMAILIVAGVVTPASAVPNHGQDRVTICHQNGAGAWTPLTLAERGATARLRAGDAAIGDSYPGSDDLVFSSNCEASSPHADASMRLIESIRADYEPPCETPDGAVECEPGDGGALPPIEWDQALADRAQALAAECPVFTPRDESELNLYLHWSPERVTDAELVQLAIQNWAEKIIQYDVLTGNGIRIGDNSTLSYKRLLTLETLGIGSVADCPNNRGVVVMLMTPDVPEGPVYGAVPR